MSKSMEITFSPFSWIRYSVVDFCTIFFVDTVQSINFKTLLVGLSLLQPKGRAIQVEDGISERQPSVDIRRSRNRDSDVVIQVCCYSLSLYVCVCASMCTCMCVVF